MNDAAASSPFDFENYLSFATAASAHPMANGGGASSLGQAQQHRPTLHQQQPHNNGSAIGHYHHSQGPQQSAAPQQTGQQHRHSRSMSGGQLQQQHPHSGQTQQQMQQEQLAAAAAMGIHPGTFSNEISLQIPRFLGNPVIGIGQQNPFPNSNIGDFGVKDGMFVGAMDGYQGWFPDFSAFGGDQQATQNPNSPFSATPHSKYSYSLANAVVDDQTMSSPNPPSSAGGHHYTTPFRSPFDFPTPSSQNQQPTSPTAPAPFEYPLEHNTQYQQSPTSRRQSLQQNAQPPTAHYNQPQPHSALGLSLPGPNPPPLIRQPNIEVPHPKDLQIMYSSTGFDMLGVLARVATRPNPKIVLGPVDMTCSFLVVDVRKWDCPIVYASPTFTRLTGYTESEILGRNCRFLQAPPDCPVEKGAERTYTAPDQVQHLYKYLSQDKECQASLINYRKTGEAFINLVTVIPIAWDSDQIAYHVGFQVDLTEQPHAILQTMRDGSYIVNYSSTVPMTPSVSTKNQSRFVSREMKGIIASAFGGSTAYGSSGEDQERLDLNMALLEHSPDVVHVLSLKGSFLFVSPSVKRVLEYEQTDLLGKSISDICHPSDVVPLMRELKDSSPTNPSASAATGSSSSGNPTNQSTALTPSSPTNASGSIPNIPSSIPILKTVNLLFRVRRKHSGYVWVECIGRLYSEPGKGRKAIILTARRRDMPRLAWANVEAAGGVGGANVEFWGQVSREGIVLVVSANVKDVVGRGPKEVVGQKIFSFISPAPSATSPSLPPVDGQQQQQSTSKIEEVRNVLEEAVCAKPGDERARIAYCDAVFGPPADGGSGGGGQASGMVAVEIAFFPPSSSSEGGVASGNSATAASVGTVVGGDNGGVGGGNGTPGGGASGSQSIQMVVPEPVPRRPPRPSPPISGSGAGPPLGSSVIPARAAPPPASSAIFRVRMLKSQQEVAAVNNGAAAAVAARRRYSTSEGVVPKPAPTGVGSAAAAGGSFLQRSNSTRSPTSPGFGGPRPTSLTVGTGNVATSPTMSTYGMTSPTVSAFSPTSTTFPSTASAFASPPSSAFPTLASNTPPSTIALNSAPNAGSGSAFTGPTTSSFGGVSNPTGNVFEELEITRGTSWMYELQQLKISNKRMRDEVEVLEKQQHQMQIQAAQAQAQAQAQAVQVAQAQAQAQAHMQAQVQAQAAQMQQQAQEKANGASSGAGQSGGGGRPGYNSPPTMQTHGSASSMGSMHSSSSSSSGLPMQGIQHSGSSLSMGNLPMQGMQQSPTLPMGGHSQSSLAMHPLQHSNSGLPMMGMHHTNSSGSMQMQMQQQQQHSQMQQAQAQAHAQQQQQHPMPSPLHRGSSSGSSVSVGSGGGQMSGVMSTNGGGPNVMSATAAANAMMGMMAGGPGGPGGPVRYNTGAPEPASKGKKKRTRDSFDDGSQI